MGLRSELEPSATPEDPILGSHSGRRNLPTSSIKVRVHSDDVFKLSPLFFPAADRCFATCSATVPLRLASVPQSFAWRVQDQLASKRHRMRLFFPTKRRSSLTPSARLAPGTDHRLPELCRSLLLRSQIFLVVLLLYTTALSPAP